MGVLMGQSQWPASGRPPPRGFSESTFLLALLPPRERRWYAPRFLPPRPLTLATVGVCYTVCFSPLLSVLVEVRGVRSSTVPLRVGDPLLTVVVLTSSGPAGRPPVCLRCASSARGGLYFFASNIRWPGHQQQLEDSRRTPGSHHRCLVRGNLVVPQGIILYLCQNQTQV